MNEIEKLYENVRLHKCTNIGNFCKHIGSSCERCKKHKYPPFIAEKQLELIKWSARREPKVEIGYSSVHGYWVENPTDTCYYFGDQFDNALASLINILWQDLTAEEKQQIKEILQ